MKFKELLAYGSMVATIVIAIVLVMDKMDSKEEVSDTDL